MLTLDVANHFTEIIVGIFAIIGTLIGFIAWFIRLEAKVLYLEKDHAESKKQIAEKEKESKESTAQKDAAFWAKMDAMQSTLNQVLQVVGELKGRVEK